MRLIGPAAGRSRCRSGPTGSPAGRLRVFRSVPVSLLFAFLMGGCAAGGDSLEPTFSQMASPAGPGSGEPRLHAGADGRLYLSWIEPDTTAGHRLRYAFLDGDGWSPAATAARGERWFVNWADVPSLVAFADGSLAAHWLERTGDDPYSYGVRVSRRSVERARWSPAAAPHRDGTPTEHGFVSMLPWDEGRLLVVWLDGRNFDQKWIAQSGDTSAADQMTLRAGFLAPDGSVAKGWELDSRVCECCGTDAVRVPGGALVAYRDRSDEEIRNISVVRFDGDSWSEPRTLHDDSWEIFGCPVNGPALAAVADTVAAAWFTAAGDDARVNVAFSFDGGARFRPPFTVDGGDPLGRVDVVLGSAGRGWVSWLEAVEEEAEIRVREIGPKGPEAAAAVVSRSSPERAGGFPRMESHRGQLVVAWTDPGSPSLVHVARSGP
jgi:hypothetical protein